MLFEILVHNLKLPFHLYALLMNYEYVNVTTPFKLASNQR